MCQNDQQLDSAIFDIEDGEVKFIRCKIDSRNFNANYLLLDKMPEPLELSSIDQSLYNYPSNFQEMQLHLVEPNKAPHPSELNYDPR